MAAAIAMIAALAGVSKWAASQDKDDGIEIEILPENVMPTLPHEPRFPKTNQVVQREVEQRVQNSRGSGHMVPAYANLVNTAPMNPMNPMNALRQNFSGTSQERLRSNMVPFMKSNQPKQYMGLDDGNHMLERHMVGGQQNLMAHHKSESSSRFQVVDRQIAPGQDPGKQQQDVMRQRTSNAVSRLMTSQRPIEPVYVGPGISQRYDASPSEGKHSVYRPQFGNVDDLRIKSKPRLVTEGRTVDGQKGSNRGIIGNMTKPIKTKFISDQFLLPNRNQNTERMPDAEMPKRPTARQEYTKDVYELRPAAKSNVEQAAVRSEVVLSNKLPMSTDSHLAMSRTDTGTFMNLSKGSMESMQDSVRPNQRDTTSVEYTPQAKSAVNALPVDPEDQFEPTIRETLPGPEVGAAHTEVNKSIVWDPEHLLKDKQVTQVVDYTANAKFNKGSGYLSAQWQLRSVQGLEEQTPGWFGAGGAFKEVSAQRGALFHAKDASKEITLVQREPTEEGAKQFSGKDGRYGDLIQKLTVQKRVNAGEHHWAPNAQAVAQTSQQMPIGETTREKIPALPEQGDDFDRIMEIPLPQNDLAPQGPMQFEADR